MTVLAPSVAPTLTTVQACLGADVVPEWVAHMITALDGVVSADVWLDQYAGDWNDIPAIRCASDYAVTYRWVSKDDFLRMLRDPDSADDLDVPQQRVERFIVVEVLKELAHNLDRDQAVKITQSLAANLMSHAFQRVSADYTWDRVLFDTIPFMVDFAQKTLLMTTVPTTAPASGTSLAALPPSSSTLAVAVDANSAKLYAWHVYIEMESQADRLQAARAAATELMAKRDVFVPTPLHGCCRGTGFVASDVAAVLVVEHRQKGDVARITDTAGDSVLHNAVRRQDDDAWRLVRVLYSAGANVKARDARGRTALAAACAAAAPIRIVEELLQLDAELIDAPDSHGLAPIHYAVRVQRGNLIRFLAERDADLDIADHDGFTPAHIAASSGSVVMLELLATLGGCLEKSSLTGLTPLAVSARRHHLQAVLFLFQARNYMAARRQSDDDGPDVVTVLRRQLPDLVHIPQVSISSLGLDHLPVEIGYLRCVRRLDVRHNKLRSLWMTPWWWLPVFSRKVNTLVTVAYFLFWGFFVTAGIFTPSTARSTTPVSPFALTPHHYYVFMMATVAAAFLLVSLFSGFIRQAASIECRTRRTAAFAFSRTSNLITLATLFIEHVQLAALAYPTSRDAGLIEAMFRASLFDFGMAQKRNRNAIGAAVALIYTFRIWIECRSFIPKLWAYDRYLQAALAVFYLPMGRAVLSNLLEDMAVPAHSVLLLFSVPSFLSIIPIIAFGEVALLLRDGQCQIRPRPMSSVAIRALFLALLAMDVILNRVSSTLSPERHQRMLACWLLPVALIMTSLLGRRVLHDETLALRAAPVWAALIHAFCLAVRPANMPESFALLSWPISIVAIASLLFTARCRRASTLSAQAKDITLRAKRDVLFQLFRLHPQYDAIDRDFGCLDLSALQKRYDLDRWLRDEHGPAGTNAQVQIVPIMSQIERRLPVHLPSL